MKLMIQIPCYNEEQTLQITLSALPKQIEGIDQIEYLIIDDGSTDNTIQVARDFGVHHFVRFPKNLGLARGFMAGLEACIQAGADIIVNTDADNQYNADDIPLLVRPILDGKADMVIGERPVMQTAHFSILKKMLQKLGSWVVRKASGTSIPDAPSGFRAFSRNAAAQLRVFNEYTYTLETIIQAGHKGMAITSVPIRTNRDLRPSKLVKSIRTYVVRSLLTIVRIFIIYRPLRFFLCVGGILFSCGFLFGVRFLYFYFIDGGGGHIQSLILASLLLSIGFSVSILGVLADLISVNRRLLEETSWRIWSLRSKLDKTD